MSNESGFREYGAPRWFATVVLICCEVLVVATLLTGDHRSGLDVAGAVLLTLIAVCVASRLAVCVGVSGKELRLDTPFRSYTVPWSDVEWVNDVLGTGRIKVRGRWPSFQLGTIGEDHRELMALLYKKSCTPRL